MFKDVWLILGIIFLLAVSIFTLKSVAPSLFPLYFVYLIFAVLAFWFFSQIDFDIVAIFSKPLYVISIFLLVLTLIIGTVTRGTIRWIPLGPLSLQPAELVRPFLLVFFADFLTRGKLTFKKLFQGLLLLAVPVLLILVQPSLGVSILTTLGFFGVLIASNFEKKYILTGLLAFSLIMPIFWFMLAPYQKQRILTFVEPSSDPLGAGYNSLQSTIAVGSGGFFGKGLGHGVQTQLSFLPEKQTDFIFAAISEELGFFGAALTIVASLVILYRLIVFSEHAVNPAARAYLSGFFTTYLIQVLIHTGMNMGLLPITGLPLPLVSAGGSSLLATMIGLGIALGAWKKV